MTRRPTVWLDLDVWAELRAHADRLHASISALMQHAWTLARPWIAHDDAPPLRPLWTPARLALGTSTLHIPPPPAWMRCAAAVPPPTPPPPLAWPPARTRRRAPRAPSWTPPT